MATVATLDVAAILNYSLYGLYAILGLGLVIFFHELGHFGVAKWCNVYVERFSIGFGPILLSKKWGETEYALSAVPFGGYVKMLGQDDMDPSQLSSEEIAEDPRSYSAKTVGQRMAIISAGVIMNIITGTLFCAGAFVFGVNVDPAVLGIVQPGMPAWKAGLETGDTITRVNGREASSFKDIVRGVALTSGDVTLEGIRHDGTPFTHVITPDGSGTRRMIGAGSTQGLSLVDPKKEPIPFVIPGSAAAKADPPFQAGDTIRKINDTEINTFWGLQSYLSQHRSEPVDFYVARADQSELTKIHVPPQKFVTLGLSVDIGQITAIQQESPAAGNDGLRVGDKITAVNGQEVGRTINPLELPDLFASLHGQTVDVQVSRQTEGGDTKVVTVQLTPADKAGWTDSLESAASPGLPLVVPSLGIAFHLIPTVLKVEEGSPAQKAGIPEGARIKSMELNLVDKTPLADVSPSQPSIKIEFDDKSKNWVSAFLLMQQLPGRKVKLTASVDEGTIKTFELAPAPSQRDWFLVSRGTRLMADPMLLKATGVGDALAMGVHHTWNTALDIYLTLQNLFAQRLSVKELHGPIGIATVAYKIAEQGLPELLLFLGFLSVNLAVLNFLPIPVLDGGHMVFLLWEAITRRKPTERILVAATYCGMAFVLGLMLLVLYLDIFVHKLGLG